MSGGLALLLIAVFLLQWALGGTGDAADSFVLLDFGANAGFLVEQGEWYRLVTANLLHGGWAHLGANLLFLVIYGPPVERQVGWRRTLLVVLASGLGAQAASAFWMEGGPFASDALMSMGFSGSLFGLLGLLGLLNIRFRGRNADAFRLTPAGWLILLGLNLVIVPLISAQVDTAAHLGGLITGFLAGALLVGGERTRAGRGETAILAVLGLVWAAGIGEAALTALDPGRRAAEHRMALHAVRGWDRVRPAIDNEFAWAVATAKSPTPAELDDALFLANRAAGNGLDVEARDTLATVQYRLAHFDEALAIEQPLTYGPEAGTLISQMARFLDARVKRDGLLVIGGASEPAQIALRDGRLDLSVPEALPKGGEIYALVRRGGVLKGMIRIFCIHNDAPLRLKHLEIQGGTIDPGSEIVLAEMDKGGTHTDAAPAAAYFYPIEKSIATLP